MDLYTQENRTFAVQTALGSTALLLAKFTGREGLNEVFSFRLDLFAPKRISFEDVLGKAATLRMSVPGSPTRYVNGMLASIEEGGYQAGSQGAKTFLRYQALLVPVMYRLRFRIQSRIWQRKSVPEILQQILHDEWGLAVQSKLTVTYPTRDYCVQYQESDLAFVMRLMEDEGIWFCFEHSETAHTLILGDCPTAHPALADQEELRYSAVHGNVREQGRITEWQTRRRLGSTKARVRDYHFAKPNSTLDAIGTIRPSMQIGSTTNHFWGNDRASIDHYPGDFARRFDRTHPSGMDQPEDLNQLFNENQRVADLRVQSQVARMLRIRGQSDCAYAQAGHRFSLADHFSGNGPYVLTQIQHHGDQEASYLAGSQPESYHNSFRAIPHSLTFRPQCVTPKPKIAGTQTAFVVGPAGQETFLDRFGRVKVKFHWDNRVTAGPESSCWVRVSQVWAGRRWGAFFWPRVGHEVVVTFEDGDPERPLIVGSVYNDRCMPPFELPEHAARAGIKSFSMSGDFAAQCDPLANFNGIVFSDVKGDEHTEIHSEKDAYQTSEHDFFQNVNGIHRVNVSDRQSVHVGTIPTSSSGTGYNAPFFFNPTPDLSKNIGVNFTSVVGLNQTNTLGIYGAWTVGDVINIVNNPVGLLADAFAFGPANPIAQAVTGLAGANFGGIVNLTYGSQTSVAYGSQINVGRSGRAAISNFVNYRAAGVNPAVGAMNTAALVLSGLISAANVAAMVVANMDSYSSDDVIWESVTGVSLSAMALLSEVEVAMALATQAQTAIETSEAAAMGTNAKALAVAADNVASLLTNDQKNMNRLEYTEGCVGTYSTGRITGVEGCNFMFAGRYAGNQSSIAMDKDNIKLALGPAVIGASLTMVDDAITLSVGGACKIAMTPASLTLSCGSNTLTLTSAGIVLECGTSSIEMNLADGIMLENTGGMVKLTPEFAYLGGMEVQVLSVGALDVTCMDLTETVLGTVAREASISEIL